MASELVKGTWCGVRCCENVQSVCEGGIREHEPVETHTHTQTHIHTCTRMDTRTHATFSPLHVFYTRPKQGASYADIMLSSVLACCLEAQASI